MILRCMIFFFIATAFVAADELPWIGVSFERPQHEEREAVKLAEGVALKVAKVIPASPLAKAGGEVGDLWWKFDDQILVNKRQMLVLLRAKSPGDSVKVDFYRGAELKSFSFKLAAKQTAPVYSVGTRDGGERAKRVLSKREQIARVTVNEEELTLQREGEGWRFEIMNGETSLLSALVNEENLNEIVPAKWHGAFIILRLTLEQQGTDSSASEQARIRYVPREKSSKE